MITRRVMVGSAFAAASALLIGATPLKVAAQDITGAGSTFVYPAMSKWAYEYSHAHTTAKINYQSVGSGAGIAQYKAGTVDFGATDAPLTNAELGTMPLPTLHIPVVLGSEVLAYNLPGIGPGLRLSGDVIAGIYLGEIKTWKDARIQKLNPAISLPDIPITVIHRSDGSGTTYIFTDYLSSVSGAWKSQIGKGKSVSWSVGLGGRGNEGVSGLIINGKGTIGYVELAYAIQNKLAYGPIRNRSGNYVLASTKSTSEAAAASLGLLDRDVRTRIVDSKGVNAYPIAGFTYVLISRTPRDAARARAAVAFLKWVVGPGQGLVESLGYAPLPPSLVVLDERTLGLVHTK